MYWDMDDASYDPIVGCWMSKVDRETYGDILAEGIEMFLTNLDYAKLEGIL